MSHIKKYCGKPNTVVQYGIDAIRSNKSFHCVSVDLYLVLEAATDQASVVWTLELGLMSGVQIVL